MHKKMINFLCIEQLLVEHRQLLSLSLAIFAKEKEQLHGSR